METYEQEYRLLRADIEEKLNDLSKSGENSVIQSCQRLLNEIDEVIGQMEIEITGIPTSERGLVNGRIRSYRSTLEEWRRHLKEEIGKSDRKALFGNRDETSGDYIASDQDYDQRTRLLQGTNRLEQSSQRLLESQRIANETEGIGASILRDLHGQRNQLEHSLEMLGDTSGHLDRSLRTLKTMARRLAMNRFFTTAIIAILVILILLVLYSKFR
ncbi:Vesicle transport v-SNARE protein vti1 [Schizosaccharomyces pombe]|uniref:Vesicle transport v-SNARE protein vti1 n=1 Tax=Schizosaccharomyces pombe (strain 972 / ATCC 24843) TaxID=284812 RepID=VTI1_SCHPO|nr:putative SNARE protein Vti1 [Schizosaccharomyces pombe]P78768.2 RecName: Full=Vesicle transport v-SNARE protein vti1 [Schizosaccharomyces pombe 972h-]CAA17790.1 SNARE Vti1 (predicted) [Schizosaccharomyces pombe]|eukprot:NP_596668.1 putative SNARE protein Vti1 [Schizosaccharomyces pombe]